MKTNYILTIKAEDRSGLLRLITGVVEKRQMKIISLNSAPTDIHGLILVTVEVTGDESLLTQLAFKLENILEVFTVDVAQYNAAICLRAAYFRLSRAFMESPKAMVLVEYETSIVKVYPDAYLLAKYGTAETIIKLYNELDGPHLLGFSQTGLITDTKLINDDQNL